MLQGSVSLNSTGLCTACWQPAQHHSLPAHTDHPAPQLLKGQSTTLQPPTHPGGRPESAPQQQHATTTNSPRDSFCCAAVLQCAALVRSTDESTGVHAASLGTLWTPTRTPSALTKRMHAQSTCLLMPILNHCPQKVLQFSKTSPVGRTQHRGAAGLVRRSSVSLQWGSKQSAGQSTACSMLLSARTLCSRLVQPAALQQHNVWQNCTRQLRPCCTCRQAPQHVIPGFPKVTHSQQPDLPILPPRCPPIGTLARQLHEGPGQSYTLAGHCQPAW